MYCLNWNDDRHDSRAECCIMLLLSLSEEFWPSFFFPHVMVTTMLIIIPHSARPRLSELHNFLWSLYIPFLFVVSFLFFFVRMDYWIGVECK